MPQIFHRSTNMIARVTIFGGALIIAALAFGLYEIAMSPWYTEQNDTRQQPAPFSHRHHAGELGIDCRYCHTTVETSSFAGMPPTETCMSCGTAPNLVPRISLRTPPREITSRAPR